MNDKRPEYFPYGMEMDEPTYSFAGNLYVNNYNSTGAESLGSSDGSVRQGPEPQLRQEFKSISTVWNLGVQVEQSHGTPIINDASYWRHEMDALNFGGQKHLEHLDPNTRYLDQITRNIIQGQQEHSMTNQYIRHLNDELPKRVVCSHVNSIANESSRHSELDSLSSTSRVSIMDFVSKESVISNEKKRDVNQREIQKDLEEYTESNSLKACASNYSPDSKTQNSSRILESILRMPDHKRYLDTSSIQQKSSSERYAVPHNCDVSSGYKHSKSQIVANTGLQHQGKSKNNYETFGKTETVSSINPNTKITEEIWYETRNQTSQQNTNLETTMRELRFSSDTQVLQKNGSSGSQLSLDVDLTTNELKAKLTENELKLENLRKGFRGIRQMDFSTSKCSKSNQGIKTLSKTIKQGLIPYIDLESDHNFNEISSQGTSLKIIFEGLNHEKLKTNLSADNESNNSLTFTTDHIKPDIKNTDSQPIQSLHPDTYELLYCRTNSNAERLQTDYNSLVSTSVTNKIISKNQFFTVSDQSSRKRLRKLGGTRYVNTKSKIFPESRHADHTNQILVLQYLYNVDLLKLKKLQYICKQNPDALDQIRDSFAKHYEKLKNRNTSKNQPSFTGEVRTKNVNGKCATDTGTDSNPVLQKAHLGKQDVFAQIIRDSDLVSVDSFIRRVEYFERILKAKYAILIEKRKKQLQRTSGKAEQTKEEISKGPSEENSDDDVMIIEEFQVVPRKKMEK